MYRSGNIVIDLLCYLLSCKLLYSLSYVSDDKVLVLGRDSHSNDYEFKPYVDFLVLLRSSNLTLILSYCYLVSVRVMTSLTWLRLNLSCHLCVLDTSNVSFGHCKDLSILNKIRILTTWQMFHVFFWNWRDGWLASLGLGTPAHPIVTLQWLVIAICSTMNRHHSPFRL